MIGRMIRFVLGLKKGLMMNYFLKKMKRESLIVLKEKIFISEIMYMSQ